MINKFLQLIAVAFLITSYLFIEDNQEWTRLTTDLCTINYPVDWIADKSRPKHVQFALLSNLNGADDLFKENLIVVTENLQTTMTLQQYAEASFIELKNYITTTSISEIKVIETDHQKYAKITYVTQEFVAQRKVLIEQRYYIVGSTGFVLTVSQLSERQPYQEVLTKMADSFKIKS